MVETTLEISAAKTDVKMRSSKLGGLNTNVFSCLFFYNLKTLIDFSFISDIDFSKYFKYCGCYVTKCKKI